MKRVVGVLLSLLVISLGGCGVVPFSVEHVMPEIRCNGDVVESLLAAKPPSLSKAVEKDGLPGLGLSVTVDRSRVAAAEAAEKVPVTYTVTIPLPTLRRQVQLLIDAAQAHPAMLQLLDTEAATEAMPGYFFAYFRKGRFATVALNTGDAKTAAVREIYRSMHITDTTKVSPTQKAAVEQLAQDLIDKVCSGLPDCALVKADEEGYFYNRAGQKFGFPTVAFSIDPLAPKGYELTKIDEAAVVADLTRVTLEAFFDGQMKTLELLPPADPKATACGYKDYFTCVKASEDQAKLRRMNNAADMVEGVAGAATAQVIRGGGWISLNNEAAAKFVETLISVTARKFAEAILAWNEKTAGTLCTTGTTSLTITKIVYKVSPW